MTVVTSSITPVTLGTGQSKTTVYTATRTTKLADGTFDVDILQYNSAKGDGAKVIGTRDPGDPNKITFNSNASGKIRTYRSRVVAASKNQMESMRGQFVAKAQEAEAYNSANGQRNRSIADPTETGDDQQPASLPQDTPAVAGGKTRFEFSNLKYPSDLADTNQDVVKFTMFKFIPKKLNTGGGTFGLQTQDNDRTKGQTAIGSVILPITSGIKDTSTVQFGSENLDPVKAELALLAYQSISKGGEGLTSGVSDIVKKIQGNSSDVTQAIVAGFAGQAAGVPGLLTRATGAILNPNTELLFKGPQLRTFNFSFTLAARSSDEADEIIKIIRFFKQGMKPIRTKSNLFLKTPHIFGIQYLHEKKPHKFLNNFRQCALTSFNTDYTSHGQYATFSDGKMVSYVITMGFSELNPIYNDDYTELDGNQDTQIGF